MADGASGFRLLDERHPVLLDRAERVEIPFSDDFSIVVLKRGGGASLEKLPGLPAATPDPCDPHAKDPNGSPGRDPGVGRADPKDDPENPPDAPEQVPADACVRAEKLPEISPGRTRVHRDKSPTSDTADGKTREYVAASIEWNNTRTEDNFEAKYMKSANEASVYSTVQTFDSAIAAVNVLSETVKGLPDTFVSDGLSKVDDKVRNVRGSLADLAFGKLADDVLIRDVAWEFELAKASQVTIKHVHQWLAYTEDSGIYDFQVKGFVDGPEVVELRALSEAERRPLMAPAKAPTSTPPSATPAANTPPPIIKPPASFAERLSVPQTFTSAEGRSTVALRAGRHRLQLIYELKAGYGGLFDQDGIDKANDLMNKVVAAVQELGKLLGIAVRRLFGFEPRPDEPTTAEQLQAFTKAALDAALAAAGLLIALLEKLFEKSLAYVRLRSTDLEIACVAK